jgi:hypothetical protein
MNLRELLPSRDFVIETTWPPEVAGLELRKRIDRRWFPSACTPFVGESLGPNRFSFTLRRSWSRNSFEPVAFATIEPASGRGARVRVHMRMSLPVIAFLCVWIMGALVCAAVSLAVLVTRGSFELAPLGMVLGVVALVVGSFIPDARKMERAVCLVFADAPGPPPYR